MYDLLLQGGTVIDGSGAPVRTADVAVSSGRIARIGSLATDDATRRIDVSGLAVAPGFIDVHAHSDGWLLRRAHLEAKTSQGFTTEVIASDGISYAPLVPETAPQWIHYLRPLNALRQCDYRGWRTMREYLELIDRRNVQNAIALTPFANLRVLACGWGRPPADDSQVRLMQSELARAMREGAVGLSTGLDYIAQCFASTDEIARVCEAMSPDGLYVTHVRYKLGVVRGVQEAVEIGRRAGVRVHISHLKGVTPRESDELLSYLDSVATNEVDLTFDTYPYMAGSSMLGIVLPYEVWEDGPAVACAKLCRGDVRRRVAAQLAEHRAGLENIRIAWVANREHVGCQGMSLAAFAAESGKPVAEAVIDLLIDNNLAVLAVFDLGDDRHVEPFLTHAKQMVGSDGIYFDDAPVHPRVYGTAPRVLGPLVRERRLFSLEEAVQKLSGFPAARFDLVDRGLLKEGAVADVVVFDPATITDNATYDEPNQMSQGIHHVLIGGRFIIECGKAVATALDDPPGRALEAGV